MDNIITIRDKQTGELLDGPANASFDTSRYEIAAEERAPGPPGKSNFFDALGQAATETVGEIPERAGEQWEGIKNFFGDRNTPLRLSGATVPGLGPVAATGVNWLTEALAQWDEDEGFKGVPYALGAIPVVGGAAARGYRALPNFLQRIVPGKYGAAHGEAIGGLEEATRQAEAGAVPQPQGLGPQPRSLTSEVDEFSGNLQNAGADAAFDRARAAIPDGRGPRVSAANSLAKLDEFETHVIPKGDPGAFAPLTQHVQRLRQMLGGGEPDLGTLLGEIRNLGALLKDKVNPLDGTTKGYLGHLWGSLMSDLEAAAASGAVGAREALEAATAYKRELAGEGVAKMGRESVKGGDIDPETLARKVRLKTDPLDKLGGEEVTDAVTRMAERHRIEQGVRTGAEKELAKQQAAHAKTLAEAQKISKAGVSAEDVRGRTEPTIDIKQFEDYLNRNEQAIRKAYGEGGVKIFRDFIEKNRGLPTRFESPAGGMTIPALIAGGGGAAYGASSGSPINAILAALAGVSIPPAVKMGVSGARAVRATPPNPSTVRGPINVGTALSRALTEGR